MPREEIVRHALVEAHASPARGVQRDDNINLASR
jgi:hypothetical protein